jgi:hypothetical protein
MDKGVFFGRDVLIDKKLLVFVHGTNPSG